jgi:hypothetical protein
MFLDLHVAFVVEKAVKHESRIAVGRDPLQPAWRSDLTWIAVSWASAFETRA